MGKALGCPQAAAVGDQKIGSLSFLHCFEKAATGASFGRRSYGLAWRKETQLRITVLDGELGMVAFVYPSFLSSLFLFFVIDLRCTIARRLLNVAMGLLSGQQQKEWLSDTVDEVGPTTQAHTHTRRFPYRHARQKTLIGRRVFSRGFTMTIKLQEPMLPFYRWRRCGGRLHYDEEMGGSVGGRMGGSGKGDDPVLSVMWGQSPAWKRVITYRLQELSGVMTPVVIAPGGDEEILCSLAVRRRMKKKEEIRGKKKTK